MSPFALQKYRLHHTSGSFIEVSNLGASWLSWVVADRSGGYSDVLLGYPDISDYVEDTCYMGACVGRFANRIAKASFVWDGRTYTLEKNDGENSNHGGFSGWHKRVWKNRPQENALVFEWDSPHLEGGYPGRIRARITYRFTAEGAVRIDYDAVADRSSLLNMTNHAYFNLSGEKDILSHELMIPADRIVETDAAFIPTGRILPVEGSAFDFRHRKKIADNMDDSEQLRWNKGYNHCYVLSLQDDKQMRQAASVFDPRSGRQLDVYTTYPGVLFYTGGYLQTEAVGKQGEKYAPQQGFCIETQYFPDTPKHPHFPSCSLSPQQAYRHTTIYQLRVL